MTRTVAPETFDELATARLAEVDPARPFGLYLHVPFCASRCGYCDFNTYTAGELGASTSPQAWAEAVRGELAAAAELLAPSRPVETIFVGGGTPSLLGGGGLASLLESVRAEFELAPGVEVTTESNPDSVTMWDLDALRSGGFTRISFGMQSAVPHVLRTLERTHDPARVPDVVRWARDAGLDVSLGLIYGTPGESLDDWRASLDAVTNTPVDHVSAYSLIVEEGTRLAMQVRRGTVPMPDDDDLAAKYLAAEEALAGLGFDNYEVSNWARPGGECRHNLAYWRGDDWWGIGPGAHSHVGGVRFWNRKHPRSYAQALAEGNSPALAREVLDDEQRRVERVLLELRLREGLPLEVLTPTERARLASMGDLVEVFGDRVRVARGARLLADGVIRDLLD